MCRSLTLCSVLLSHVTLSLSLYLSFIHSLTFTVTLFPKGELYLSLSLTLYLTLTLSLRHQFDLPSASVQYFK